MYHYFLLYNSTKTNFTKYVYSGRNKVLFKRKHPIHTHLEAFYIPKHFRIVLPLKLFFLYVCRQFRAYSKKMFLTVIKVPEYLLIWKEIALEIKCSVQVPRVWKYRTRQRKECSGYLLLFPCIGLDGHTIAKMFQAGGNTLALSPLYIDFNGEYSKQKIFKLGRV